MRRRLTTTKTIAALAELYRTDLLDLSPEFQRDSVWPRAAKAYFLDTLVKDRPVPMMFFQRQISPRTGRAGYTVIDGQQRLRAVLEFLDGRVRLTESPEKQFKGKDLSGLSPSRRNRLLEYQFTIEELSGYSYADIVDIFVRMNKYVVKLSPQELRHARGSGRFKDFAEKVGHWLFWPRHRVFSALALRRMRSVEFAAELAILEIEGPQDKKKAIDLYYVNYREAFPPAKRVLRVLTDTFGWIESVLPDLDRHRYRKPVDLYGLMGALRNMTREGRRPLPSNPARARERLLAFEQRLSRPDRRAAQYLVAASQQTDNIGPRQTRIEILTSVLTN